MEIKERNFGLDIIRAISITLVVIAHMFVIHEVDLGVWGVEVFFVLSGFLIGQIIIKDFSEGVTLKKIVHFWKRRWFRTLPLYYAIILIKFLFFDSSLGIKILVYIFFLQNNFVGINFLPVSWSLVVEEWFYLVLPVLVLVFFKNGIRKNLFLYFLLSSIVLFLIIRYLWVLYTNRPFEAIRANFPFRFDSLLIGVLLAHLKLNYGLTYSKFSNPFICITAIIMMIYLAFDLGSLNIQFSHANSYIWYRTGWFSVFSFSIFFLIPFMESSMYIKNLSSCKLFYGIITWTSILTYSIYLIHLFIFKISLPFESIIVNRLIYIFLIYSVSYLIYNYFEHPMIKLREKKNIFFSK